MWGRVSGIFSVFASLTCHRHHYHTPWYSGSIRVEILNLCLLNTCFLEMSMCFLEKDRMNLSSTAKFGLIAGLLRDFILLMCIWISTQFGESPFITSFPPTTVNGVSLTLPHTAGMWYQTPCLRNICRFFGAVWEALNWKK